MSDNYKRVKLVQLVLSKKGEIIALDEQGRVWIKQERWKLLDSPYETVNSFTGEVVPADRKKEPK